MNIAAGPRKGPSQEERPERLPKEGKGSDTAKPAGKLFTFTIDADTAQVVKFEAQDASGARCEISEDEKGSLVHAGEDGLEEAFQEAFEAGIDCVLGGANESNEGRESARDAELRHLLLTPLIEHSPAKRLLQPEVLNRAILGTLILHAMQPAPTTMSKQPLPADPARTPNRAN
jgi:hypothetical protein